MFWAKLFQTKTEVVVALCDEDLLEKTIEVKRKNLKIKISKHFYGGELVDDRVVLKLLGKSTVGNLIGKNVVELAEKGGFISHENVISIGGVPHAQFVKL